MIERSRAHRLVFLWSVLALVSMPSLSAQTRCECNYTDWIRDCTATVTKVDKWIRIGSDTPQCSRVDWVIEGQPQTTIVTGGEETQEWLGRMQDPKFAIQSCKVCKDAFFPTTAEIGTQPTDGRIEAPVVGSKFQGHWVGAMRNPFGKSKRTELDISVNGSQLSGWMDVEGSPRLQILDPKESGNSLVFIVRLDANLNHTMTLTGPDSASVVAKFGVFTSRGELARRK